MQKKKKKKEEKEKISRSLLDPRFQDINDISIQIKLPQEYLQTIRELLKTKKDNKVETNKWTFTIKEAIRSLTHINTAKITLLLLFVTGIIILLFKNYQALSLYNFAGMVLFVAISRFLIIPPKLIYSIIVLTSLIGLIQFVVILIQPEIFPITSRFVTSFITAAVLLLNSGLILKIKLISRQK